MVSTCAVKNLPRQGKDATARTVYIQNSTLAHKDRTGNRIAGGSQQHNFNDIGK